MNFYNQILLYFNLKKANDPKREAWIEYAAFYIHPSNHPFSDSNLCLLALILLAIFVSPIFYILVVFAIYFRILAKFGDTVDSLCNRGFEAQELVNMIQNNHMQSMKEKFINDPYLINCMYKKRSLLYWTKHYNNLQAHKMIIDLMKQRNIQKHNRKLN